jgi:hypothetical protein
MKIVHIPRVVAAAVSLFAAFGSAPASAVSSVYFVLNQSNINASPYQDGQNYLQVTISDNINGNIDFKVETLAPLSGNAGSNYGIDSFGFNTLQSVSLANILAPTGWTLQTTQNQDGFGNFTDVANTTGQYRQDPLMFSITGISGDTAMDYVNLSTGTAAEGNVFFAAHVAGLSTQVTSGYFGGSDQISTPVPEPETYAMLLAGLGLVGFAARRKLS